MSKSSSRGMRLRGLGMGLLCCVFVLMLATNLLWFKKTQVEKKLEEKARMLERVQVLLDEEKSRAAGLEKKLAALPSPREADSRAQIPQASTVGGAQLPEPQDLAPSRGAESGSTQGTPPAKLENAAPLRPAVPAMDTSIKAVPDTTGMLAGGGAERGPGGPAGVVIVPVIVMSCCRPEYLETTLRLLQNRMPKLAGIKFEIVVSQDGEHTGVQSLMQTKFPQIKHMQHIDKSPVIKHDRSEMDSYYMIARHYGWALGQVFENQGVEWAIILEDDIEIAPDFFHYMAAGAALLRRDSSLWTVTAWNDNSFPGLVQSPSTVYRSDFFAGLGWIMTRNLWQELGPKWPKAYWDDWMREPAQRQGRACIRPEISRTVTFGKEGSSHGQFFKTHLSRMVLNSQLVDFTQEDWSYLIKANYDGPFLEQVSSAPRTSLHSPQTGPAKLTYTSHPSFMVMADQLGIMSDEKAGVPRTGYLGVVTLRGKGGSQLYVAPEQGKPYYQN